MARRASGAAARPGEAAKAAVSEGIYSTAEEVVIGSPIPLEPDALPCDVLGCDRMGSLLIPGASVCDSCWAEHLDGDGRYYFPPQDLVGDERWREARRNEYALRVALMSPRRRDPERDAILEQQVRRRVELLLEYDVER